MRLIGVLATFMVISAQASELPSFTASCVAFEGNRLDHATDSDGDRIKDFDGWSKDQFSSQPWHISHKKNSDTVMVDDLPYLILWKSEQSLIFSRPDTVRATSANVHLFVADIRLQNMAYTHTQVRTFLGHGIMARVFDYSCKFNIQD